MNNSHFDYANVQRIASTYNMVSLFFFSFFFVMHANLNVCKLQIVFHDLSEPWIAYFQTSSISYSWRFAYEQTEVRKPVFQVHKVPSKSVLCSFLPEDHSFLFLFNLCRNLTDVTFPSDILLP